MENPTSESSSLKDPPEQASVSDKSTTLAGHKGHNKGYDEVSPKIDALINTLSSTKDKSDLPEIPQFVEEFTKMVGSQIDKYVSHDSPLEIGQDDILINMVGQLSKLSALLDKFTPDEKVDSTLSLTNPVVQRAMALMEKELKVLMQEGSDDHAAKTSDADGNNYPGMSQDTIKTLRRIIEVMISGGYPKDCSHAYTSLRKDAFTAAMKHHQGFEYLSHDDVQKMAWETLESHIAEWVKVTKHVAKVLLPGENNLCASIFFPEHASIGETIITNLTKPVVSSLINLAESASLNKQSAERLFKVLDIYEALTDLMAALDSFKCCDKSASELKSEILVIRRHLRESIVAIFTDLENSIKNDVARTPVPGGAVHPLTRYIINYLRYACDFRDTLESIFSLHHNNQNDETVQNSEANTSKNQPVVSDWDSEAAIPPKYINFATELIKIMGLLDNNLEAKSKLYKDQSLRYVFLMNNGRYVLQKIKESTEIREVMGDDFRRKRSSDLRGYHKSYQRETWSRVLQCLNQEGLQVHGKVQKTLVKERLKSFNQMFDEIYKTQSTWVVSDKQLQSELRVSISAVMIPAYRSFVARFGQCFGSSKQAEKYIKYQPDDIEASIEALFDGNGQNLSMARRRLSFPH